MKRSIMILGAALLCGVSVQAQNGPWSLQDCIDYALEHNLTVQQSALAVEQREVELNSAQNRRLPALSASASENLSFGRGLTADNTYSNSNTTSTSFSLGGEMPVFQGFDIANGIKLGKLNLAAATADLEKARDDIRVAVAQAFVQILYNQELLRVAREQSSHDEELLEQIRERLDAGKVSAAEVAAQQATLAQSRQSEIQAEGNLNIALLDLTQLLELPSPEGFSIVTPEVGDPSQTLLMRPEAIYAEAVEVKPSVEAAKLNVDYAELAITRAKGAYLPSISLSGGLGSNYYTNSKFDSQSFGEQLKNNFSQYIGLSMNVPIFTRFNTRNNVRNAELSYKGQQIQLENVKKSLYKEIQQAYYNAVASQGRFAGSRESAESARLHYELTEEKYRVGKAGVAEYNDARNNWLRAESEHIQARFQCLYQTKLLDFYRGRDLQF
ncbi:MAG: TolC family protein [Bacteroidales bacterium]|jgi:outer membrane protein|nr:TolC family protein [Bacteroidales bacterium]